MQPTDRFDLGKNDFLLNVLEHAELANDVRRLFWQDAPDRRVIHVNREAVGGRKLNALAGGVSRIIGRGRAHPVAAVEGARSLLRTGCIAASDSRGSALSPGHDGQAGLGVSHADDVDAFLFRIEEIDSRLKNLLLNAAHFVRAGVAGLVGHDADIPGRNQGWVVGPALKPRGRLGAGVDVHDFDVKSILIEAIAAGRQNLAEDASITGLIDQVRALRQRLADLGDHDTELAGGDDLVLHELGLVFQGRVEMASGPRHVGENADPAWATSLVGLHKLPLGALRPCAKGPGSFVPDQEAVTRGNLDAANDPLPDAQVKEGAQDDDRQEGLDGCSQKTLSKWVHGCSSPMLETGKCGVLARLWAAGLALPTAFVPAAGSVIGLWDRRVNSLKSSMSGPSVLPRIVWNDGASLAKSMFRAMAPPSPPKAATWAAKPEASAALSNLTTCASAEALAM